jgi:hypothetical protein
MEVVATTFGVHRNQDRFIPSWGLTVGSGPFLYTSRCSPSRSAAVCATPNYTGLALRAAESVAKDHAERRTPQKVNLLLLSLGTE